MSDALEDDIDDGSKTEEIDDAEDVVTDDNRPVNRTYFINCQTVYSKSFNADGVRIRDVGNHLPQVSCMSCSFTFATVLMRLSMSGTLDRGGTVVVRPSNEKKPTNTNEGASSSKSAQLVSKFPRSQNFESDLLVSNIRLHWLNHPDL